MIARRKRATTLVRSSRFAKLALTYYLDTAWPLLGLSTWFVDFAERLMRDCVLYTSGDVTAPTENGQAEVHIKEEDEDVFGSVLGNVFIHSQ